VEAGGVRPRCLKAALEYAKQGFWVSLLDGIDTRGLRSTRPSGRPRTNPKGY
jgi:hypothetical protein